MIVGAHSIIYSTNPEADRAFLRDVLGMPHVDVGEGWLIFGLPPAEVAVHPSEKNGVHEFYLMCDDVGAFVEHMASRGIACGPAQDMGWGVLTQVTLPGGGELGVYQPRHARPETAGAAAAAKPPAPRAKARPRTAKKTPRRAAKKAPRKVTKKTTRRKATRTKATKKKARRR